jgi:hypothetical protein
MHIRFIACGTALALVPVCSACKDSTTPPAVQAAGPRPSFVTASDTLPGGGGGPGNQTHFVSNGTSALVIWSSGGDTTGGGGGFTSGSLSVSRGGTTNNPQTFLSYFVEQCSQFSCTFMGGSGLIPNGDLSGGTKQLHLGTNTSGNPNFFTFGGSPGVIMVDWAANGLFTLQTSGTWEVTFPGFRRHQSGVSTSASAFATGNVVGIAIPPANFGNIGTNENVTIDISH